MPVQPINKKRLKILYGISYPTLKKWLESVPGLNISKKKTIFNPHELTIIYNHLGKPDGVD